MKKITLRDVEILSASLDGQISRRDAARLEARLRDQPGLAAVRQDLKLARQTLRRTPTRVVPRNFTLKMGMAGIRPPVPRAVPALSWASALAMLAFIFTVGTNLVGKLATGSGAPILAAAPMAAGGYGVGGGPAETQAPAADNGLSTPSLEAPLASVPNAAGTSETLRNAPPDSTAAKGAPEQIQPWPYLWLGLALALLAVAGLWRWISLLVFRRKTARAKTP